MNYMQEDYGLMPYVGDVEKMAKDNENFRMAIWTGTHMQMTLMSIPVCGDIGSEVHKHTDQFIRIEQGKGEVIMQADCCGREIRECVFTGDVVFVPAGTRHNIMNKGCCPLKLSSIYAPPNHPKGTIHRTKEEAQAEEMH